MGAAFTYMQKMDISYYGDKTGFPRPSHIYKYHMISKMVVLLQAKERGVLNKTG